MGPADRASAVGLTGAISQVGDDGSLNVRVYVDLPAGTDYTDWTTTAES